MRKIITIAILALSINAFAQVPSYVPTSGLVAYYPFSGNANDQSGNSYNGTVTGASLTSDRFGNANSAYSFTSGTYISVLHAVPLRLSNTDFTISSWIFLNDTLPQSVPYGSYCIMSKRLSTPNSSGYIFGITPGDNTIPIGAGYAMYQVSGGGDPLVFSNSIVSLNNWEHVLITYTNSTQTLRIYFNGVLNITQTGIPSPSAIENANLWIGNDVAGSPYFFHGKLDDIGVWNRALTQQEITDLYNGCQLAVSVQPTNQSVNISTNVQFIASATDPAATYQWQTDLGVGFQNLNSVGQYSGTTNDTLTVSNTTLTNNNQPFRCIVSSGSCTDTTSTAVLTVVNNVGINEFYSNNLFSVYPNPASTQISVKVDASLVGSVYTIFDNVGKVVLSGKINSVNTSIELDNLSGGIYLFSIGENMKQRFKIIKE